MRFICALLTVLVAPACLAMAEADSWKLPMADKERLLEENIQERHNILGLYPSQVEVPLDGSPVDQSTLGISNIAHSVCWTANYLAGCSFRYAVLKDTGAPAEEVAGAKARADEVFEAVYRCQLVTGVRGLQARGYALGHGEAYEEREDASTRDEWHQGTGEYAGLRWRGDPSHHNYSDSVHGLMQYWRLAAEGDQKARATEAIDALVSYWVDNDYKIHKLDRTRPPVPILGYLPMNAIDTRKLMAIAGAKYAHYVTGKPKFLVAYNDLIEQTGLRGLKSFPCERDFDDAEHCFTHLENLINIEEDPALLAAYRVCLDALWAQHTESGQSLFTYIYAGLSPGAQNMETPMAQALQALETWPTSMIIEPRMSSLSPNLKPPFPVHAASWDNEYMWKGNLLRGDGWLSRIVTDLAVPEEDPLVAYALDPTGAIYQSRDACQSAAGWHVISKDLPAPAHAIEAGPKVRMVYAVCGDGFYASVTGGRTWRKLPVPSDGGRPLGIQAAWDGSLSLYATTTLGAYYCPDFGEEFIGKTWRSLSEGLPRQAGEFYVAQGDPGRVYALLDTICFSRRLDEEAWQRGGTVGLRPYAQSYPWFITDPHNPDHVYTAMRGEIPGVGERSLFQESMDGGLTWSNDLSELYEKFHTSGLVELMSILMSANISEPALSHQEPGRLYMGKKGGITLSENGGGTWRNAGLGFDIPWAQSIFAPRHGARLYAGTPAGLYLSEDGGDHWRAAHLVLQFDDNTRREIGGAAYIDAYWRARFHGFITEDMAKAPYTK